MKLLVTDFDNTLYTTERDFQKNIKKITEFRKQGNLFVIATGRSYRGMIDVVEEYRIPFDYLVLNQGAVILDHNLKLIQKTVLEPKLIRNILAKLKDNDNVMEAIVFGLWDYRLTTLDNQDISKLMFRIKSLEAAHEIKKQLYKESSDIKVYVTINRFFNVEIIAKEIHKGQAIKLIAERENINKEDIHVIGDASNDYEMIEMFNGSCMTNAEEEIMRIAKRQYHQVHELIADII